MSKTLEKNFKLLGENVIEKITEVLVLLIEGLKRIFVLAISI